MHSAPEYEKTGQISNLAACAFRFSGLLLLLLIVIMIVIAFEGSRACSKKESELTEIIMEINDLRELDPGHAVCGVLFTQGFSRTDVNF
jgi:hypothetical protein